MRVGRRRISIDQEGVTAGGCSRGDIRLAVAQHPAMLGRLLIFLQGPFEKSRAWLAAKTVLRHGVRTKIHSIDFDTVR